MFSFFGGGHGGHPEGDGLNHGNAPISMATIPPLEILEAAYPVKFNQWALRQDSGGPGRNRGGLGAVYEVVLLENEADVFLFGERGRYAPPGVLGGDAAARNRFEFPGEEWARKPTNGFKNGGYPSRPWTEHQALYTRRWRLRQCAGATLKASHGCSLGLRLQSSSAIRLRRGYG